MSFKQKIKQNLTGFLAWSFLIILGIYMAITVYITDKKWSDPELEKRYTIATVVGYRNGAKSPPWYIYEFKYQGKEFEGRHSIVSKIRLLPVKQRKKFIGHKWIVKFIADDPDYSELFMKYYVADSIQAPKDGWDRVPGFIKE